jgi:hypothetical protein
MDIVDRLHEAADRVAKRAMGHDLPALISIPRKPTDVDAVIAEAAAEITRLRKERDEARAALTWQPIETAPKDGTEILVCGPDKNGGLYRAVQRWPENWGLYWPVTYMAYAAGEPAHWMPLPPPPEATK